MIGTLNGWNLSEMTEAVEAVKRRPEAGILTWRSRVTWDGGFGLDVRTSAIEQLGETVARHFTLRGDHPPELLGHNTGPTAVETLLAALGSCMAGTFAAQATARGLELSGLEVAVEGKIDLNGFFGLRPVHPGLSDVKLAFQVQTPADEAALREVLEAARTLSPVFASLTQPLEMATAVTAERVRPQAAAS